MAKMYQLWERKLTMEDDIVNFGKKVETMAKEKVDKRNGIRRRKKRWRSGV